MQAREFGQVFVDSFKRAYRDDITGLAAQAAFAFAFSLFPLLLVVMLLVGLVGQAPGFQAMLRTELAPLLPADVTATIVSYVDSLRVEGRGGLLSLSILLTLWSASGVVTALMKGVNLAYDAEREHSFLRKRLVAVAIIFLAGLLVIAASLVMVFGPVVGTLLDEYLGYGEIYDRLFDVLRFPFALVVISLAFAILYRLGPNVKHYWLEVVPGALLGTLLWMAITFAFSLYVERFGRYDKTYGSLGGLIVLLTWMYLTTLVVIYGAEFNAAVGARRRRRR